MVVESGVKCSEVECLLLLRPVLIVGDNNISYLECVAPKKIQWIKLYAFHSLDYVDIITYQYYYYYLLLVQVLLLAAHGRINQASSRVESR